MLKIAFENISIALSSIRSQMTRTCITIFIIAIGIWALVAILSVVNALKNTIIEDYSSMGANTLTIQRYSAQARLQQNDANRIVNPPITYKQALELKENYHFFSSLISISFNAASGVEVKSDRDKTDPEISIVAVDENYLYNSGLTTEQGRNFNYTDINSNHYVCIIGADLATGLFKGQDPVDQLVSIRGYKFKIIGVLKPKGNTFGNSEDQRIFIPIGIGRAIFTAPDINYTIKISITKEGYLDSANDLAQIDFRNIRGLSPSEPDNFGIARSDDMLRSMINQTNTLNIAAWMIGLITILGSSIALMNIMLVSVTERTKEIGIRKALGATRRIIAWQFFTETVIIGQLGGILGTALGVLTAYVLTILMNFSFALPYQAIIAAFITTFFVAIVSGLYPALKASKLDPVEALRYE